MIRQIITAMEDGELGSEPTFAEKRQCMLDHLRAIHQFYAEFGEYKKLGFARKHISCYLEKLAIDITTRKSFNRLQSVEEQTAFIEQLVEPL